MINDLTGKISLFLKQERKFDNLEREKETEHVSEIRCEKFKEIIARVARIVIVPLFNCR